MSQNFTFYTIWLLWGKLSQIRWGKLIKRLKLTPFMAHLTPLGKYILQNVDQLAPFDMAYHTAVGI